HPREPQDSPAEGVPAPGLSTAKRTGEDAPRRTLDSLPPRERCGSSDGIDRGDGSPRACASRRRSARRRALDEADRMLRPDAPRRRTAVVLQISSREPLKHHDRVDVAMDGMAERARQPPNDLEAARPPQPNGALVRAHDEVE